MFKNKIAALFLMGFFLIGIYACKKSFLDVKPEGSLDEATLTDALGVNKLLVGAYAELDNYDPRTDGYVFGPSASNALYGDIGGGIANKGSAESDQKDLYAPVQRHETNSLNNTLNVQWKVTYEGIKRCNEVLRVLPKVTGMSDDDKNNVEGQAKFLRAWYYFQLRIIFNKVPYIDVATDDQLNNGEIKGVENDAEIFPMIIADAKFAYENLPETQDAVGRVNKWSAGAFYGKVSLYTHDFATARQVLNDVIDNGKTPVGVKYDLNANFADNFNVDFDNSKESVFAFQASANDNAGTQNSNWGDMLNTPVGGGAAFYTPTYYFVNKFKTDANGLPVANAENNEVLDPYTQAGYTQYAGNIDPRLDWTIGRDGVPYHDWGVMDHSWVRTDELGAVPYSSGPFHPKKGCIRNSQVAGSHDPGVWFATGAVSLNINLIRFADVLLMAAEAEAEDGAGSLGKAFALVNRVRARAASTPTVKKYIDDSNPSGGFSNVDAGTYKAAPYTAVFAGKEQALAAIRLERALELGLEGFRFFDLVRWGIVQQELNDFYQYESKFPYAKILKSPSIPAYTSPVDDYYPIPQKQIDLSFGFLKQP
jgi:starch-binding outer membrane protein, SusD/RagB family